MVFQPIPQWCLPFPAFAARSGLHLITNITSESPLGVVEPQELEAHGYRSSHPTCLEVRDGDAVGIYSIWDLNDLTNKVYRGNLRQT